MLSVNPRAARSASFVAASVKIRSHAGALWRTGCWFLVRQQIRTMTDPRVLRFADDALEAFNSVNAALSKDPFEFDVKVDSRWLRLR